ncbi:Fic family protein [Candidatus Sumerlaeota bacterium]|nr:Fic family protein [Candidatus Sumerlaeota bacterium]
MIRYRLPENWIKFDLASLAEQFIAAKAAIKTLGSFPFQRDWVEELQRLELRREVAGTSRIEGADFTENELDEALKESPAQLFTRSQRQAHAAAETYRWIATIPDDRPVDADLICEIHRRMVTGADDDHCPPGVIRGKDQNVNFGAPRHRGAEGGGECKVAFGKLIGAINGPFRNLDPLLRGLAAHYHIAAVHPFLDGNGRTARALEILFLQRAGLRDICFIAVSNYYYEEKQQYLQSLTSSREAGHDLRPFFLFALRGLELQAERLIQTIRNRLSRVVFRNLAHELFDKLTSERKRIIAKRQLAILDLLLGTDRPLQMMEIQYELFKGTVYRGLKNRETAFLRDLEGLVQLSVIEVLPESVREPLIPGLAIRLKMKWPEEITGTEFYRKLKSRPSANIHRALFQMTRPPKHR